jgi:predicted acyl esterase
MGARKALSAAALAACVLAASAGGTAHAAAPLGLDDCGRAQGVYQCSGLARTWDGIPLDTTVTLPSANARNRPLVVEIHGFGNSKYEYLDPNSTAYTDNAYGWARDGYAVLTYTARGLWGSCGTPESRLANPGDCADGYIHLADVRYEGRDTQTLIGRLVDEGVANPRKVGVTGDSYGGGQSFMLAALRNRVMLPSGKLTRWRSPDGTRLRIAAAAPVIPWTDLVYAAAPNGKTRANGITPRGASANPVGVEKASFVNAIYAAGQTATGPGQPIGEPFIPGRPMGWFAPPGVDPEADVASWVRRTDQGEPYEGEDIDEIVRLMRRYHSAYYIKGDRPPAPLFVGSGFTDDLFPVDEALRFANRTRKRHPGTPVSLLLGDFGHQRASNKPAERKRLLESIHAWFDHHLRGRDKRPRLGATAFVQTCPRDAPGRGPFHASTFGRLADRALRFEGSAPQTILSTGGDPSVGAALDPVTGGGNACAAVSAREEPGTATYDLRPRRRGTTVIGAPAIGARLAVGGGTPANAQIAARLWDVAPDGESQTLVARGTYRPHDGRNRWQLHPAAWRFEKGHMPRLQLLGADAPYARPSNGSFDIEVKGLRLRLPVRARHR